MTTIERSCRNCARKACAREHQWAEEDCRFFKPHGKPPSAPPPSSKAFWPYCPRTSCNGNEDKRCQILTDNDFHGRPCPFYKRAGPDL